MLFMKKQKINILVLAGALLVGIVNVASAGSGTGLQAGPDAVPVSRSISTPVIADPVEEPAIINTRFVDVQGHWAIKDIIAMDEKGILQGIQGISEELFGPNEITTRNDLIATLEGLIELKLDDESTNETQGLNEMFDDVTKPVTRMEAAQAIEKCFEINKLSVMMTLMFPVYDDTADMTPEESSALSFVFNTGIMKGKTAKEFAPGDPVTRAELVVILNRTSAVLELAEPVHN